MELIPWWNFKDYKFSDLSLVSSFCSFLKKGHLYSNWKSSLSMLIDNFCDWKNVLQIIYCAIQHSPFEWLCT